MAKVQKESTQSRTPYCTLSLPDGSITRCDLQPEKNLIGRLKSTNDIALSPDKQNLVTRTMHCSIEKINGLFYVVDNASTNGTFLKRDNEVKKIVGREKLQNEDKILILRALDANETPDYWEIAFFDPEATVAVNKIISKTIFEYDWIQAKAFRFENGEKFEIKNLTPQEHKMLRFLDQKNKSNNNIAVMCSYDEIISAIWEDYSETKDKGDVNHLVALLRKKVELDPDNPKILKNIRGMGYCLETNL